MSLPRTSAHIREDLDKAKLQFAELEKDCISIDQQMIALKQKKEAIHDRMRNLKDQGHHGMASRVIPNLEFALSNQMSRERVERDDAFRVVWFDNPPFSAMDRWVVDRVTNQKIYVICVRDLREMQFNRRGKGISRHNHASIDIRKTFGIDADEVPADFLKKVVAK